MRKSKDQKSQEAHARKYKHYVASVLPALLKSSPVAVGWEDTPERVASWIEQFHLAKKAAREAGCPVYGSPTAWSSCSYHNTWDHVTSLNNAKGYMHDWIVDAWQYVDGMDFAIDGFDRIENSRKFFQLMMAIMPKDPKYLNDGGR